MRFSTPSKLRPRSAASAIYLTDGRLADADEARESPLLAAASNWHALAAFAARFVRSPPALLLDMGSTTADIIPLDAAALLAIGRTDPERLLSGELVYTGVERTPVLRDRPTAAVAGSESAPSPAELFATTADAYLLLGDLPEDPHIATRPTAGREPGRRRTPALARMICADATLFTEADAQAAAKPIRDAQLRCLETAQCRSVATRARALPRER